MARNLVVLYRNLLLASLLIIAISRDFSLPLWSDASFAWIGCTRANSLTPQPEVPMSLRDVI